MSETCRGECSPRRIVSTETNTAYALCRTCGSKLEFCYPGDWQRIQSFPDWVGESMAGQPNGSDRFFEEAKE